MARHGDKMPINSPVRCSKANVKMEGAIWTYQRLLRTLRHLFERGLKTKAYEFMCDVIMVCCLDGGCS